MPVAEQADDLDQDHPQHGRIVAEGLQRGLHRGLNLARACRLKNADNLRRLGGIERLRLLRRLQVAAADDQVVFAAQFVADFLDGRLHAARVLRIAEVKETRVAEVERDDEGDAAEEQRIQRQPKAGHSGTQRQRRAAPLPLEAVKRLFALGGLVEMEL